MIPKQVLKAAFEHAHREYPKESCGLIVDGAYLACFNYAIEPLRDFVIATEIWVKLVAEGKKIEAVVHSHPDGPIYPSARDMQGQVDTAVPWVILPVFGDGREGTPTIWGDERPAIIGRQFMHGVTDCYSLIEDVFALGHEELAKQGVDWPLPPVVLRPYPRNDAWWSAGDDLYMKGFREEGFYEIAVSEAKPGDAFFCKIRSEQINHAGLLIGGDLILHHLPQRLSRREPAGMWGRAAVKWVRYGGQGA